MVHQMGIHQESFQAIKAGKKIAEVRLNDPNKQKIKVGDTIQFVNFPNQDEAVCVQVVRLQRYATFNELYQDIPLSHFACENWEVRELLNEIYDIYEPEREQQWGVLVIYYERVVHV